MRWLLYAVLLTPLLTWGGFLVPHLTPKVLAFQILVESVLLLALGSTLMKFRPGEKRIVFRYPVLFAAYALYWIYLMFSAILGVDLNRSLWGILERQDGLVLQFHFFVWAMLLFWVFGHQATEQPGDLRTKYRFNRYLWVSYWVSVAVALSVLMSPAVKVNGLAGTLSNILFAHGRLSGVFGNPIFTGPYLMFHLFYGLYFIFQNRLVPGMQGLARLGGLCICELVILVAIMDGQTRGVFLGLASGLLLTGMLFVFVISHRRWLRICALGMLLAAVMSAALAFEYRDSPWVKKVPVLQRVTQISFSRDLTTFERIVSWQSGLRGFVEHPLLGWGHNNSFYALTKYYDPRQVWKTPYMLDVTGLWFDKSHNFLIDLLIDAGAIGCLFYLILLGLIAHALRKMKDRFLAICLAGALLGYAVSNLVAFDSFGSLFGFFLTLACVALYGDLQPVNWTELLHRKRNAGNLKGIRHGKRGFAKATIGVIGFLCLFMMYLQVQMAFASRTFAAARGAFDRDPALGIGYYLDGFNRYSPYAGKEKLTCAGLIVESVVNQRKASRTFDLGRLLTQLVNEAIASHPLDASSYIMANEFYNELALNGSRDFAVQAEVYGRKAVELSPKHQQALYGLSRTFIAMNRTDQATEVIRRMLRDEDFPMGHWFLGLCLLQNKQHEEGKKEIFKAREMGCPLNMNISANLRSFLNEKEIIELASLTPKDWSPFARR
jgi:hypothetical protein